MSGNFPDLLSAMREFAKRPGRELSITFGADLFGSETRGSDYLAVAEVLEALRDSEGARVFLYHERGRTFHPKLYLFSNDSTDSALLVVGSSNWSEGGFVENVEANVVLSFDLTNAEHRQMHTDLVSHFDTYWRGDNA
jgi:HKD family nuclease